MRTTLFAVAMLLQGVDAQWPVNLTNFGPARYVRIAQMNGEVPSNGDVINLDQVSVFDCNGNWLRAAGARMSTVYQGNRFPPTNCINNQSGFCHGATGGGDQFLEVDMGAVVNIGRIVVVNRRDCCRDRIEHYDIALFSGANGIGRVSEIMQFSGVLPVYVFNVGGTPYAGGGCQNIPHPTTVTGVATMMAALSAQVSTMSTQVTAIPQNQLQLLQSSINAINATQVAHVAEQVANLSATVAAESSTAFGNLVAELTTTATTANATSMAVASLSQNVADVSTIASTAQASAASTSASFVALRDAITGAANSGTVGSGESVTPQITADASGTSLNVASGLCQSDNLCDSSRFAANLKEAIRAM